MTIWKFYRPQNHHRGPGMRGPHIPLAKLFSFHDFRFQAFLAGLGLARPGNILNFGIRLSTGCLGPILAWVSVANRSGWFGCLTFLRRGSRLHWVSLNGWLRIAGTTILLKLSLTLDRKDEFASGRDADRHTAVGGCIFGFLGLNLCILLTDTGFIGRCVRSGLIRRLRIGAGCWYFRLGVVVSSLLRPRFLCCIRVRF